MRELLHGDTSLVESIDFDVSMVVDAHRDLNRNFCGRRTFDFDDEVAWSDFRLHFDRMEITFFSFYVIDQRHRQHLRIFVEEHFSIWNEKEFGSIAIKIDKLQEKRKGFGAKRCFFADEVEKELIFYFALVDDFGFEFSDFFEFVFWSHVYRKFRKLWRFYFYVKLIEHVDFAFFGVLLKSVIKVLLPD